MITEAAIKSKPHLEGDGERRLHTGIRFSERRDPAHSVQTSPQVARAAGHPVRENVGGLDSSSSLIRRFYSEWYHPEQRVRQAPVARRFRGESHHKVDNKGRVSIPASFRRVLEQGDPSYTEGLNPELVIVYGDHRRNYLECYTIQAINEVDLKIDALPRGTMERRMLQRLFHGQSFPTAVDETGRLVLPSKLRTKIDLESEAFFIAAGDTFQIWKTKTYETEELAKTEAWLDDLPEDFDPLVYLDNMGQE